MRLDPQDVADLKPIIAEVVGQVLRELAGSPLCSQQIGFTEAQAAALIGLPKHQLRDARVRGDIKATVRPGMKQVMYSRRALLAFVEGNETTGARKKRRGKNLSQQTGGPG